MQHVLVYADSLSCVPPRGNKPAVDVMIEQRTLAPVVYKP